MWVSEKNDGRKVVYYSCAETAKLIRAELKKNFAGVKFSVRSSVYSGGASIRVHYNDANVAENAVREVAQKFEGASFDAMTDYKDYHNSFFEGQEVSWGSDYVFVDNDAKWSIDRENEEAWAAAVGSRW